MRSTVLISRENVTLQCRENICRLKSRLSMCLEMETELVCLDFVIKCHLNIHSQKQMYNEKVSGTKVLMVKL